MHVARLAVKFVGPIHAGLRDRGHVAKLRAVIYRVDADLTYHFLVWSQRLVSIAVVSFFYRSSIKGEAVCIAATTVDLEAAISTECPGGLLQPIVDTAPVHNHISKRSVFDGIR